MRRRRFSKQKIPPLNIPLAISNSRQLDSEQTGTPRNEAPAVPTSLPKGPQSSINVYLKIVPAASTSTSTWPLAPTSAPVPPVTFFVRVFCFFEVKVERRTRSEGRNREEVRAESGGESPREREEKKRRFAVAVLAPTVPSPSLSALSLSPLSLFSLRTHRKHEWLLPRDAAARGICLNARHLESIPGRQSPFKGRRGGVDGVAARQRGLELCDRRVKVGRDSVVESHLDEQLAALGNVVRGVDRRRRRGQVHVADNGPRGLGVLEHIAVSDHHVADRVAWRGPGDDAGCCGYRRRRCGPSRAGQRCRRP